MLYSLAKELQSFRMHLPDIIQINELREFLTERTLYKLDLSRKITGNRTHLACGKHFLDLPHLAPVVPPTQWAKQPRSYYQVGLE
jgi:hypothetical protein